MATRDTIRSRFYESGQALQSNRFYGRVGDDRSGHHAQPVYTQLQGG